MSKEHSTDREHAAGESPEDQDRRSFLTSCGRFAAFTPPVMTMLLSTTMTSEAIAKSGGKPGRGGKGRGKGRGRGKGKGKGRDRSHSHSHSRGRS